MPICPRCSATIHTGADDQCPACGYSLKRADATFGDGLVGFRRVEDAAGALTHQERQDLLHFLADLERSIPPAVLCIYITDYGQTAGFRPHAHWILNHAQIHHPSFGRRQKRMAIEDADMDVRIASEHPHESTWAQPQPGWFTRVGSKIRNFLRDALHPNLPPPVQQEWMLILVLDVQLEMACFSWGYQLDPYIDPNSINRCIVRAKLQFRERAMVSGLRRVMKGAVREIAAGSRKVNARLRRQGALRSPLLLTATLGASLLAGAPAASAAPAAQPTPAAVSLADDDVAEEVPASDSTPKPDNAPQIPPPPEEEQGHAASYNQPGSWSSKDKRHLLAGEMPDAYRLLLPAADTPRAESPFRTTGREESDTRIPGRYSSEYHKHSDDGLSDPQGLLGAQARRDVEYVLHELNANGRYRIYVAVLQHGQKVPQEMAVQTLIGKMVASPGEYAALLLFPLGNAEKLEIGYQSINPGDEKRHAWLAEVRRSAAAAGGDGLEALLAAIRKADEQIRPLSAGFTPPSTIASGKLAPVNISFKEKEKEEKSWRDDVEAGLSDEANRPYFYALGALIGTAGLLLLFFYLRRRSGQLLESSPDIRLSSPYGAGVSRYVRYLEGKESPQEKRLF